MSSSSTTVALSEPRIEVSINNILVSKKNKDLEIGDSDSPARLSSSHSSMPSNFIISAKIDEESRKEGYLVLSFSITLNDPVNLVTYEFKGICAIEGTSQEFEHLMKTQEGGAGESKIPKILDILYQRLYSLVFMLAGMTAATYPQSTTLSEEAVQARRQEANPVVGSIQAAVAAVNGDSASKKEEQAAPSSSSPPADAQ